MVLHNDGLIDKKEGYSIQHKDGKLIINDKEALPKPMTNTAVSWKNIKNSISKKTRMTSI